MKHERNIRPEPRPTWRLKKTLARKTSFRPIEADDVKYAWAAYKKGALATMGGAFVEAAMDADQFRTAFEVEVTTTYHGAWILTADTRRGHVPVGLALGFYSHPNPKFSPFMIVGDMIRFPWASSRNWIEASVNFFNRIRAEIPMVEYADEKNKRFFEMMARHGIMRRVGTMHNVYPGQGTAVFETRAP